MPDISVKLDTLNTEVAIESTNIGVTIEPLNVDVSVAASNIEVTIVALNIEVSVAVAGGYQSPGETSIVHGTTYDIPAGKKLDSISIVPGTGTRTITVGYSLGAGEVIDAEEIDNNDAASFAIGKYYHTAKTIHFSGFTGSVLIYLL